MTYHIKDIRPMAQEGNPVPSYEALSRASCIISVSIACYHIVKTGTGLGVFERYLPDITLLLIYLQKTRMITMTWKAQRWLPRGKFAYLWAPIQWWHLQTSDPGKTESAEYIVSSLLPTTIILFHNVLCFHCGTSIVSHFLFTCQV